MIGKHLRLERLRTVAGRGSDRPGAEQEGKPRLGRSLFAWGLSDQGLSSATTLIFTVIAGRSLGPAGLGTVTLGYAAFLIALGLQRSLLIDPLLTRIATPSRTPHEALRAAVTMTVLGGVCMSTIGLVVGFLAPGEGARGMLIFAPWLVPTLAQTLLRSWLYREGRGSIATASAGVWLAAMLVAAGAGLRSTPWEVTAAWGIGGCAAFAVTARGVSAFGFAAPRRAIVWFRLEALRLGMWRTASGVAFSAATWARVVGMTLILGPAAVGGYRAIESAFAPTSLIGPALANPGLPMMRDEIERGAVRAWSLAMKISVLSTGLAVVYIVPVVFARNFVFLLFGSDFKSYENLIPPIAVGALVGATGTGFTVLLVGARRMDQTALVVLLNSVLTLSFALVLAEVRGLEAAAWGIALAAAPPLMLIVVLGRRTVRKFAERNRTIARRVELRLTTSADPEP